jgi:calcineurin-like phosphoesterase family protein
MKFTQETFREYYLTDLQLPDEFHGRTTPKVRRINEWRSYVSHYNHSPRILDPLSVSGDSKIYVWSDIHFGHKNIIKYANRPFPDTDLMNRCLEGNYLNTVTPNDVVIFGGDIGFMSENKINEILNRLPGYKVGIIGNHDVHRNGTLYQLAFNERHLCYVIDVDDHDVSYQLLFTHYPLTTVPPGCINVHGHIHNRPAPGHQHFNMSVEHTNYSPCPLSKVLEQGHAYARAYF